MTSIMPPLFSAVGLMPLGYSGLWRPGLAWSHALPDLLIGLAYVSISITLACMRRRARDTPFQWPLVVSGAFLFIDGITHLIALLTPGHPEWWLAALLKAATATAAVAAALLLLPRIPRVIAAIRTTRRACEALEQELVSRSPDLEHLVHGLICRKRELGSELETARTALEHAERAVRFNGSFLSLISHELRTPLTVITTYLQVLARDAERTLSARQKESVQKMLRSSSRLRDLIESLTEYSRIKDGRLTMRPEQVDLGTTAAKMVVELRYQAEQKQLALSLHLPGEQIPPLRTDPRLLRLILANLIGNAIKYTLTGRIDVRVEHAGGHHRLSVQDTGPGIPPEFQATVLEASDELESVEQNAPPGVGVGLTLVREMATALGARVELRSEPGVDSTFTLVLPSLPRLDAGPGISGALSA